MDKPNIPEIARFFRRLKTTQEVQEHKIADSETWATYWLEEVQKASDEDLQEKIQELITIGLGPFSLPQLLQGQRCARRNNAIFKSLMERKDVQKLISTGRIRVEQAAAWSGMRESFHVLGAIAPRPPDGPNGPSLIPAAPLPVGVWGAPHWDLCCVCPPDNERVFLECRFYWQKQPEEKANKFPDIPLPYLHQDVARFADLDDFVQELHRLILWAFPPLPPPKWTRKPRGRRRYAWRLKKARSAFFV